MSIHAAALLGRIMTLDIQPLDGLDPLAPITDLVIMGSA